MPITDIIVDAVSSAASSVTALETVTAIGATVGIVGMVTGNKALTVAGAGLAAIGGIGSLAASAGLLGDDASAPLSSMFGSDTSSAAAGDTAPLTGTDTAAPLTGTAAATPEQQAGLINATGQVNPDAVSPVAQQATPLNAATGSAPDILTQSGAANTVAPGAPGLAATPVAATTTAPLPGADALTANAPVGTTAPNAPTVLNPADYTGGLPGSAAGAAASSQPSGQQGMLASILKFGKDNPIIAYGAMQAGGALLAGLTNPMTPAQIDALNAQAEANRAAATLTAAQAANLRQSLPGASTPQVTGQPQGLINRAPQPQVTGAPA